MKKKKTNFNINSSFIYEDKTWKLYKSFSLYNGNKSIVYSIINKNFSIAEKIKKNNNNTLKEKQAAQEYLEFGYVYGILQLPTHIVTTAIYESMILRTMSHLL